MREPDEIELSRDLDRAYRNLEDSLARVTEAEALLREHQQAHGTAADHRRTLGTGPKPLSPSERIADDWRVRRDLFLNRSVARDSESNPASVDIEDTTGQGPVS